jgi:NADH-quinone oxidoreductase subunit C
MYDPASALTGTEAVFAALPENAAVKALTSIAVDAKYDRAELTITVARENIIAACQAIKAAGYNFLEDVTAVDWYPSEPRFQITYHILSFSLK